MYSTSAELARTRVSTHCSTTGDVISLEDM
jgi:hypothetical protein